MKQANIILMLFLFASCGKNQKGTVYATGAVFSRDTVSAEDFNFLRLVEFDTVEDYDKKYKIIMPAEFKNKETGFGFIYFTGLKKKPTYPHIFFLVVDWGDSIPKIVLDKNGDCDFRNDTIYKVRPNVSFETGIPNTKDNKAVARFKLILRNNFKDTFLTSLHKGMSKKFKNVLPSRFIVFAKRINVRESRLPDGNVVTLCDADVNGFFNNSTDKIIAGRIQDRKMYNNPVFSKSPKKGTVLPFSNTSYKVTRIDKYGNNISLLNLNGVGDTTEVFPKFSYKRIDGSLTYFSRGNKKYTTLYIWGAWCIGCHVQSPHFVKVMKEFSQLSDFFTFNAGDKLEKMNEYIRKKNYPFNNFRLTWKASKKLNIESFPTFLVIDKDDRIVLRTTDVTKVEKFLRGKAVNNS